MYAVFNEEPKPKRVHMVGLGVTASFGALLAAQQPIYSDLDKNDLQRKPPKHRESKKHKPSTFYKNRKGWV